MGTLDQSDILRLFILYLEKVEHLNEIEREVFGRYFHFLSTPIIHEEVVHNKDVMGSMRNA